ncbi:MAG TPA: MmgE/PrpD family protein [Acidimicrobiales bacterium]|nr:MmgE/PrpD family protein [Acidimicrobiales bacterium]
MTTSGFTAELARRTAGLQRSDLEADLVVRAQQCVLDWLGVTLAGSREEASTILLDGLGFLAGGPDGATSGAGASGSTVIGRDFRLPADHAALVNGTAGHALDYDDVNTTMLGHPTAAVLPAVLALAELTGASGAQVLTAFVAGYETECTVSRALGPSHYLRGFHATATSGTLGAAAGCANLLGLDPGASAAALGLACTQAAGLKSMFGTMAKPFHAGRAASAGLLAAVLAGRGFSAHLEAVETDQGLAATHSDSFDAGRGLTAPSEGWYLRANLFKYHASCFQTHSSIEGLTRLRAAEDLRPEDIIRVTIHADAMQMGMCAIPEPATGLEVKFSLRHTAALALAGVDTSAPQSYSDAVAVDPALVDLRKRIEVVSDRSGAGATPVEVVRANGPVLSVAHDVSVPESDLEWQGRRLREKFQALVTPVLGAAGATALAGLVQDLDRAGDVSGLMGACRS